MPPSIMRSCQYCGTGFSVWPSAVSRRRFCSRACAFAGGGHGRPPTKERQECACLRCGQVFSLLPSEVERGRGKYCSRVCWKHDPYRSMRPTPDPRPAFWSHVHKTESCWIWTGGYRHDRGYLKIRGRKVQASHFSWELHHGSIPKGSLVLHKCPGKHNPACVNPEHLALGDEIENARDREEQRRQGYR